MKTLSISILLITLISSISVANIIKVPLEYATIQDAIDISLNGDTILVSPGIYYENINFIGKNIVVISYYGITGDISYIKNTIIDGSNPVSPDTASCVLIISGEDSTAVLQGFTLTGGKGTKWPDEHGAGTYIEGGGIFITLSSPTIKNNIIVNNEAINSPVGTASAGGGGIRAGDGAPKILNNLILSNRGMYGGGIVLNYCSNAVIKNNIINGNIVYEAVVGKPTYGGGGIWASGNLPGNSLPNIIENNTVIGNLSNTNGPGINLFPTRSIVRNNIIWNNIGNDNNQINVSGSGNIFEYNDVQYGILGIGNIDMHPSFGESDFILNINSPCIDAGNPDIQFNDPEDTTSSGNALFPSRGTVRNDMGAYGGQSTLPLINLNFPILYLHKVHFDFGLTLPGEIVSVNIPISNNGSSILQIDSAVVLYSRTEIEPQYSFPLTIHPVDNDTLVIFWNPVTNKLLEDTLLIYHNDVLITNPYKVSLAGNSNPSALISFNTEMINLGNIDVNTQSIDTTIYVYNSGTAPDSIYTSIYYGAVTPDTALKISPTNFEVGSHDSIGITFTIYPPIINRSGSGIYQPKMIIDSRFSIGQKHFEKVIRFRLVGTTELQNVNELVQNFELSQNFPNPFNPNTKIKYSIGNNLGLKEQYTTLKIYDILGNELVTLINQVLKVGKYEITFDGTSLSSGVYFYKLASGNNIVTKKMILLK